MALNPLNHHYSMENPASIYDEEAMTALELAARTVAKVNETVEAFNTLETETIEHLAQQDASIPVEVAAKVQEHINNGDFDAAIGEYANFLSARVDNLLGHVDPGSITNRDAEVVDARLMWDGETNVSLGEAIRLQINSALKGTRKMLSANSYTTIFADANQAGRNTVYLTHYNLTAEMVANLPAYGEMGILITLSYSPNVDHGLIQIYANTMDIYYRYETGSGTTYTWGEWHRLISNLESGTLNFATGISGTASVDIDHVNHALVINGTGFIWGANTFVNIATLESKSISLAVKSSHTYLVYIRNKKLCISHYGTYRADRSDIVISELYLNTTGEVYWNIWTVGNFTYDQLNENLCSIFRRVCCCGDSYTSGYILGADGVAVHSNEEFAWPAFMARMTGAEYINCGKSGANVLTWQTAARGLPKAQSAGKVQAYLIGLGLNDTGSYPVTLGTADDIGTDAQTFYGGLSTIVRQLHEISPDAFIFVMTIPRVGDTYTNYNNAIREVAQTYAGDYNTHVIDLYNYSHIYKSDAFQADYLGGHYTAIGYQKMAEMLKRVWSKYINDNISTFQVVNAIEYG